MVSVIRRKKKTRSYYVLIHNDGRHQHERYLGKEIPKDIDKISTEFLMLILRKKWNENLDRIKTGYLAQPKPLIMEHLREFSLGFTHDTQKIEGSTLTEKETFDLLRFSLTPHSKPESDMTEAKLHHQTYLKMLKKLPALTERTILSWHKEMFGSTKPELAGRLRTYSVHVTNSKSRFPHWKFVPKFLREFLAWYKKSEKKTEPVELAALTHFRFASIHPFGDGNGRISRLLTNYVLIKNNCPPLNIRFADRHGYYRALEKGQTALDEIHFLKWFVKYYLKKNSKYV